MTTVNLLPARVCGDAGTPGRCGGHAVLARARAGIARPDTCLSRRCSDSGATGGYIGFASNQILNGSMGVLTV